MGSWNGERSQRLMDLSSVGPHNSLRDLDMLIFMIEDRMVLAAPRFIFGSDVDVELLERQFYFSACRPETIDIFPICHLVAYRPSQLEAALGVAEYLV